MTERGANEPDIAASSLDPLLRKAAVDAGFDLEPEREGGWWRLRASGTLGMAWISANSASVRLALPLLSQFAEVDLPETPGPTPTDALASTDVPSAAALYTALKRLRLLFAQSPARLGARLAERIAAMQSTEMIAMVTQRVGQELFREALMEYWDGRCAVTGLDVPELLRASHAKPWKNANDTERLDVHNGLLLAVHLDALFDRGLITFGDDGRGVASSHLQPTAQRQLGIDRAPLTLRTVRVAHRPYLEYHRERVFRR